MANVKWAYGICESAGVDTSKMSVEDVIKKANELQAKNGGKIESAVISKDTADKQEKERFTDTMSGKDYRDMSVKELKDKAEEETPAPAVKNLVSLGISQDKAKRFAAEHTQEEIDNFISKYGKETFVNTLAAFDYYENANHKWLFDFVLKNNYADAHKKSADEIADDLKAKYGAHTISKAQEEKDKQAYKYREQKYRDNMALRNKLAYAQNGYVEDKKSVRAAKAELSGKYPATEAAKMLGVSAAQIKANLSPSEWHHSGGTMYNRIDYYDISKFIDLADDPDKIFDPDYADETPIWLKMRGAKNIK